MDDLFDEHQQMLQNLEAEENPNDNANVIVMDGNENREENDNDEGNESQESMKKRKVEHPIWDFFDIKLDGIYCKAQNCSTKLALPKSTTNASRHLKTHQCIYKNYESKLKIWSGQHKRVDKEKRTNSISGLL
jgi:hypothetical protein